MPAPSFRPPSPNNTRTLPTSQNTHNLFARHGRGLKPNLLQIYPEPLERPHNGPTRPWLLRRECAKASIWSVPSLRAQQGNFVVTFALGVVSLLIVKSILGTLCIYFCIPLTSPLEGKLHHVQSLSMTILTSEASYRYQRHEGPTILAATIPATLPPRDETARHVRLAKQVHIPPYSEHFAKVHSDQSVLVLIVSRWWRIAKRNIALPNCISHVDHSDLVFTQIANLGLAWAKLQGKRLDTVHESPAVILSIPPQST